MFFSIARVLVLLAILPLFTQGAERSSLWLDIPFVKQIENECGAASVEMVIRYWKKHGADPGSEYGSNDHVSRHPPPNQYGVPGSYLAGYLSARGFRTFIFEAEFSDLRHHLLKGRPMIVCVRNKGGGVPYHYMVVAGLDRSQNVVLVNDPARRKLRKLDQASFEKSWSEADHWTLLAVPGQP